MHDAALRNALMLMPMAVAVLVAVAVPGSPDGAGTADDADSQHEVYTRCRAETAPLHAGPAASAPAFSPRTQSPAWLSQREAALEHCLQAALASGRLVSAR